MGSSKQKAPSLQQRLPRTRSTEPHRREPRPVSSYRAPQRSDAHASRHHWPPPQHPMSLSHLCPPSHAPLTRPHSPQLSSGSAPLLIPPRPHSTNQLNHHHHHPPPRQ
ncbi:hypothetical protein DAI22_06g104850 [Oryza sativa Japonica Group]|nr:hypothetical protein DAI22_06g104850 [Oryza sativa Japonica Group]